MPQGEGGVAAEGLRGERVDIVFRLPLPPPELRSNKRGHWATREKAREDYRAETAVAILPYTQGPERWGFPW